MEGIDYPRKFLNLRVSWLRSGRVTPIPAPVHSAPTFHRRNFLRSDFIAEAGRENKIHSSGLGLSHPIGCLIVPGGTY